jgi:predicted DNA-binding protein (MmcQ/YjbR family)
MSFSQSDAEKFIFQLPDTEKAYPFGDGTAVYRIASTGKMFALIRENRSPLDLSLKVDPGLGEFLREQYESVQPGWHLNKKHWITVLATGQLSDDEIRDLIRHSYELVRPRQTDGADANSEK